MSKEYQSEAAALLSEPEIRETADVLTPAERAAAHEAAAVLHSDLLAEGQLMAVWIEVAAWLLAVQINRARAFRYPEAAIEKLKLYIGRRAEELIAEGHTGLNKGEHLS